MRIRRAEDFKGVSLIVSKLATDDLVEEELSDEVVKVRMLLDVMGLGEFFEFSVVGW